MKKLLSLALCLFLAMPALALAQEEPVVNVYTWEGYISDEIIAAFTEATGIQVNYAPLSSNEEMLAKMQLNGGSEYDLIIAGDYALNMMRKEGLLYKLDKSLLPNYANLKPSYLSQYYDPDNEYTVPYAAGSPLIVYDPALVEEEITSYNDLWDESLAGSLVLLDDARVTVGMVLLSMGYSMNTTDPELLSQAAEKLNLLYPNIRAFDYDTPYTALISGECAVGHMFTPYVYLALQERPDLKVAVPSEGLGYGIDCLVVPVNAPHPQNAHALLNFLMEPQIAAQTALEQMYLNPNQAAEAYIPQEHWENPAFITDEQATEAEFIKDVGEAEETFQEIWQAFKLQ